MGIDLVIAAPLSVLLSAAPAANFWAQQAVTQQAAAESGVTAAEARETAGEFARLLEQYYVDPDKGRLYADAVRGNSALGAYDRVGTVAALAAMLTRDVQAVAPEGHLVVRPAGTGPSFPPPRLIQRPQSAGNAKVIPMDPAPGRSIEVARWLAPGIAYLRWTSFQGSPESLAALQKFLRDHAEAETVIFDLRTSRGGAGMEVDAVFPYLFGNETVVMRADIRETALPQIPASFPPNQRRVDGRPGVLTVDHVVTPHPSVHGLFDARVIVLTSSRTRSAGEHLVMALKEAGRATIIGEVTAGAGNFALNGARPLGSRFETFIPVGRTYDPRSGRGWEGTGIEPSIAVPAQRALVEALTRSGVAPTEAERLSASVHPAGSMERQPSSN